MNRFAPSRRDLLKASIGGVAIAASGIGALAVARAAWAAPATSSSSTPVSLESAFPKLTPEPVWAYFYQLTQIPRPSHHEAKASAFLADFGRKLGLETSVDQVGNVLIRKPATSGLTGRPGVVLQAHMDMVPVKSPGSAHTFETDPIDAYVQDGWVRAKGTTLGADDGMGVASIMALLAAKDLTHGPLEALFTVNEEEGFTGASALRPGVLRGTRLLNIDSEEEGAFTIGSAGGVDIDAKATYAEVAVPAGMSGARIAVSGLKGGHSGIDINLGRGNAIKQLVRLLWTVEQHEGVRLASLTGGDRYNAIPRDATAVVAVPAASVAALGDHVKAVEQTIRSELAATEPNLAITITSAATPPRLMAADAQQRILDALYAVPNGVIRMSDSVPGLVETSTNLGTISLGGGHFMAGFYLRSALDSERDDLRRMIGSAFDLAGVTTTTHDAYSGWTPNPASPLLKVMQTVYHQLNGHDAKVIAVHAGLETSVIGAKYPGLDMISLGPTVQNAHSPDEQLDIASVGKVYQLLTTALPRIAS